MFPEGLNITWSPRAEFSTIITSRRRYFKAGGFSDLSWYSALPPPQHLHNHYRHWFSWGKKVVRLERITCFSAAMSLRFHPQPSDVIVSLWRSFHLHGGSSASPAQGREIGPQQKAKCAFNLNNPFNLSSIICYQLGPLILLQFEGSSWELFFLQRFSR